MAKSNELKFNMPKPGQNLWFTSDTHYWHQAIIKAEYSGRPWDTVEEMNEALIANYNALVGDNDVVFLLGDFAMGPLKEAPNIARRLKGRKFFIHGNHDLKQRGRPEFDAHFERVIDFGCQIKVQDPDGYQSCTRITLCHYAMDTWNKSHFGSWSLYGHSHGNKAEFVNALKMDVGVDAMARRLIEPDSTRWKMPDKAEKPKKKPIECRSEYRPISYAEVKAIMARRKFEPIDHHRRDEEEEK